MNEVEDGRGFLFLSGVMAGPGYLENRMDAQHRIFGKHNVVVRQADRLVKPTKVKAPGSMRKRCFFEGRG